MLIGVFDEAGFVRPFAGGGSDSRLASFGLDHLVASPAEQIAPDLLVIFVIPDTWIQLPI